MMTNARALTVPCSPFERGDGIGVCRSTSYR